MTWWQSDYLNIYSYVNTEPHVFGVLTEYNIQWLKERPRQHVTFLLLCLNEQSASGLKHKCYLTIPLTFKYVPVETLSVIRDPFFKMAAMRTQFEIN